MLRVAAVLVTRDDLVFRVPYLDAAFYHFWAVSLAADAGDFADAYFLGPLYPHVLSWVYRIGWTDILVVRLLQTALGCVNLLLVLQLGRRLHAASTGFFAVLLLAFHGTLFFYEGILVMESLMTTLILGASVLLLLPTGSRRSRMACSIGVGLLLGAATVGRGTVLLLLPVSLWMLWKPLYLQTAPVAGRKAATSVGKNATWLQGNRLLPLLLILAWSLPLLPALRHNAARGLPCTLTTNAGVNFYAGNHERCRGRFRPPPGVEFFQATVDLQGQGLAMNSDGAALGALPPALAKRALTTRAVAASDDAADSAYWFQRSWEWIRSQPVDFAALLLRKAALVVQGSEIGQIESPSFHRQRLPVLRIFWVGWSLLLSLAVLGLWNLRQSTHRAATQRLAILILALLLPCIVFFVTARYRLQAVPLLCVLAAMGATTLVSDWRVRRRHLGISLLLLAVVFTLTRIGGKTPLSRKAWENAQMAERLYATGQLDEAIGFQQAANELQPQRMEIQLNLALYWSERGAPGDALAAEQVLRNLVSRFPDRPVLLFNWASLLEQTGDKAAARQIYLRVLELDPSFEAARQNFGALKGP